MRLSLLDRSRTREGRPECEALTGTIERAVPPEEPGYASFWVAEHHAVPGIASGAPPVLRAAIGARTSSIRIGSAGVMLPHHQPIVVAEAWAAARARQTGAFPALESVASIRAQHWPDQVRRRVERTLDQATTGTARRRHAARWRSSSSAARRRS